MAALTRFAAVRSIVNASYWRVPITSNATRAFSNGAAQETATPKGAWIGVLF